MTTPPQDYLVGLRLAAMPQPTPDDVQSYEEFLRQRHPMLLAALARVADELARDGGDLKQLMSTADSTDAEVDLT